MAHWFHSIPPWILVLVTSLPVLIFTLPNAFYWYGETTTSLSRERVGGPALGAVSVLSITIPLFGSLAGDLPGERWTPQTASVFWTTLVWGFFSLTIGGWIVFRFLLGAEGAIVIEKKSEGNRYWWVIPLLSAEFGGMVSVLLGSFLVIGVAFGDRTQAKPLANEGMETRFAVLRPLPSLGTEREEIERSWGVPTQQAESWAAYRLVGSTTVFCFAGGRLVRISEQGDFPDGLRPSC